MSNPGNHHKISYIEFASTDIERTKKFYATVFSWSFQDWGPDYISFAGQGVEGGGFYKTDPHDATPNMRRWLFSTPSDLAATEAAIVAAGGSIVVPAFEFPGGRRFHFSDGVGNVLGVWSE